MPFQLPALPYARDALGEFMSAATLDYHHGKHHRAYVDKTNAMVGETGLEGRGLVEVIRAACDRSDQGLFNNAAQLWNHSFFWQCLAPPEGQRPTGKLAGLIEEEFGGADAMLAMLETKAVGHFGSGWAWLVLSGGKLQITSLHDADTPVAYDEMKPLLTLDVWEHAYYLDYRNARPKFAEAVLRNIVNWDFVGRNLDGKGAARADQHG